MTVLLQWVLLFLSYHSKSPALKWLWKVYQTVWHSDTTMQHSNNEDQPEAGMLHSLSIAEYRVTE